MEKTVACMSSTCVDEIMDITISNEGNALSDQVQYYLTIFLTGTLVVWYAQFLWKRRYLYIYSWNVEGPLALPIIGCAYKMIGNKIGVINTLLKIQESVPSGLSRVWVGPTLVYFLSEPEQIGKVLNHPKALKKDSYYRLVDNVFGLGLLTAPVEKWKKHRKLLAPAFNQRIQDTFVEVFAEQSILFADQLKSVVGRTDFDLYLFASRCTLDIVCQTAMGVNMNTQKEKSSYGTLLGEISEIVMFRVIRTWYHFDWVWGFSPLAKLLEKNKKMLQDMTASVVSKKLAEHNKQMELENSSIVAEIEEEPTYKRLAILDLILKNSDLTEQELRDEVNVFLIGGTETTASSICCLFTMLGMHPKVQQKVYEEVIDILGPDRTVTASDLPQMKYTERVIKESLRLFPIAALLARSVEGDIDLGEAILPAGSSVVLFIIHMQRNPRYWPDPLKFDPDRFLPEEVAKRHPCTYIPFSYGPRNCIGWRYAIANLKTIVATVIRQYKIFTLYKSVEEINLKINLFLKMQDGPKVWIEYR